MASRAHRPSMKKFVIAGSIQNEIEAQKGQERQRIPVIVSLEGSRRGFLGGNPGIEVAS